jgi:hypothetical protein
MAKKEIGIKLIVEIDDNGDLFSKTQVEYEPKSLKTITDKAFISYLNEMMSQHAQPIVASALALAELRERLSLYENDLDD